MTSQLLDSVLLQTDFPELKLHASGKVRDVYNLDEDRLLFVATDRISAFDYVLATGIPHKGRVLTQISLFWFEFLRDLVPNHLLTADVSQYPAPLQKYADQLRGRSMIVARADMFPVECVVRGYISGSAWKEYKATGQVCGIELPAGLRESDSLPEPIFTPSTKATSGHDENISFAEMTRLVGPELSAAAARPHSGGLYKGRGLCAAKRHYHCGHQVRVRAHRPGHHSGGRGAYSGLFPLLAGGQVLSRPGAGVVRQAVRSGLSGRDSLEQAAAGAGTSR